MIRVYAWVDPRATSPADKSAPGADRKWIHGAISVPQWSENEAKNTHVLTTEPQITHLLDEKR